VTAAALTEEEVPTAAEVERVLTEQRQLQWLRAVQEMIADEPHPANVRVSVMPSRETEGDVEIHLFTQSPYHLSVVKVPRESKNVEERLYLPGLMAHQRAVANLGGRP
jgi:hypothetical protein